jgi:uncharacterized membrane protein (DUF2068 family)
MRPLGVTLAAIYQMVRGLFQLLFALGVMLFTGLTAKLASLAAEGNAISRFLAAFGKYLGIVLIIFAVVNVILGLGLWLMQGWARMLTVVFTAISLAALLPFLIHPRPVALLFGLLNVAVILYLMMPGTKRLFQGSPAQL